MLNAEKILKLIDDCKIDDVRKLCLSEIAAKMNKEKGGKSAEKAVKAMEKYVKQRCSKVNPALRGWFKVDIGIESYYCVCDGMTAILLNPENIADLPFESAEGMNVAQCFPLAWKSFEKIEIKEEKLKAVHKNARNFTKTFSRAGSKGIIVKFGDMEIDTERMANVVSALGSGTLFKNPNNKGACVYESDMGIGLILPLNPTKEYTKALKRLAAIENAPDLESAEITVEWTRSATWGSNPKATVVVNNMYRLESSSVGGCGYDKETTAIAQAMNQSSAILKMACMAIENNAKPYAVNNFFEYLSLPSFEGGVGVSSYRSAFESMGYKWKDISSGKHFDVYTIRKIEN